MIDYNTALTYNTIVTVARSSALSGSAFSQHAPCEPVIRTTASLNINTFWLVNLPRSGQNINLVEVQQNHLEDKLETIKSVFALTQAEIAKTIGVSRKTLFNWKQKEGAPNKQKAQNIFDLYLLAKNWKDSGFTTDSFELESPVISGKSVKDLLKESKLDSEKILFAGNRLSHKNLNETELF